MLKAALLVLLVVLAIVAAAIAWRDTAASSGPCATLRGGTSGGQAQLRFIDSREDHATFTFGQSQIGTFQAPGYELSQQSQDAGRRVFRLRFTGASIVNPDGSPSLVEDLPLQQPDDDVLREVRFVADADRTTTWQITADATRCPTVALKQYYQGTFPRVQLVVLFTDRGAISVEPATMVGPQVWVSGIGFGADVDVDVVLNDATVTARTTLAGTFEKALYVFDLPPGIYRVRVRDRASHDASAALVIPRQPIVPDLTPRQ